MLSVSVEDWWGPSLRLWATRQKVFNPVNRVLPIHLLHCRLPFSSDSAVVGLINIGMRLIQKTYAGVCGLVPE